MAQQTNQQILKDLALAIEDIRSQLPSSPIKRNGELSTIKMQLKAISQDQADIKEDVGMIKRKLLNPEGGIVVKVNKNTEDIKELIGYTSGFLKKCDIMESDVKECKKFKTSAHKALWVIYTAIIGLAAKLLFFNGE
jgi:hypothetical protein